VLGLQRAPLLEERFPQLLSSEDNWISHPWRPRLLLEDTCARAVYLPSTMLASVNVVSTAGASDFA
jgi:hypothetical protein